MKKSYVKLLAFNIGLILILFFNSFVMNILNNYTLLCILIIGSSILKLMLGFENKKYIQTKDINLNTIIYTITALILTYLLGIFAGFDKTPNYLNFYGIKTFIIPQILVIVVSEFLRSGLVRKSENSKILLVITTITFIFIDLVLKIDGANFNSAYAILMFISFYVLPSIAKNTLCTYLCYKSGYIPSTLYRIIMECYTFVLPIIPNYGDYINSIIRLLIPTIYMLISVKTIKDDFIQTEIEYIKPSKLSQIAYIITIIFISICIYLTSGNFKYFSLAIGSNSMNPLIHKGDMIIGERLKEGDKQNIKIGDILIYKYNNVTIVHRVYDIYKSDKDFIVYTKGDANDSKDNYPITSNMIVGIAKLDVPFVGYPTLIINNLIR